MVDGSIRVWDPLVRLFHWTLVVVFAICYLTEDDVLTLHVFMGYVVVGLLLLRLAWGIVGPRHARFADFVRGPRAVLANLRGIVTMHPRRYLGHNPAGGAMVVALLLSLLTTCATGLAAYGAGEAAGPLAGLFAGVGKEGAHAVKEMHEFFANFTLILVTFHVAGVVVGSLQHRENLVRAMVTGVKRATD